jgi:Peptidase family M1 domain
MKTRLLATFFFVSTFLNAQPRWQQQADYQMEVSLDPQKHLIKGRAFITYFNNSPDTLSKVYFHLYWNAFQPGSMMDVRSRSLPDPDRRVQDRISKLSEKEIGYQKILSLNQNGQQASTRVMGTILEVQLPASILPHSKTIFEVTFESQVPIQIRRSGRDNREGIAYSMTQWYPKIAEYDHQGWHPYQYVAREFHGVWGNYDVTINIPPEFVVAGTGKLQNPLEVGHGYEDSGAKVSRPKGNLKWHFVAPQVIDFAWAADPQYKHERIRVPGGPELHFFYQPGEKTKHWPDLLPVGVKLFQFMNTRFGYYPFDTYSIIQGGDGGMEYPMCTLILGEVGFQGTAGTMIHEVAHSWFQMALASNEALYAWMDEGFTTFATAEAGNFVFDRKLVNPQGSTMDGFEKFVKSGIDEPATQHSDIFTTNAAYTVSSYTKGSIMLTHLRYIMGEKLFWKGMQQYYTQWKFKHPEPNDFIRIMEKVSGMQLKWHLNYLIGSIKHVDYAIQSVNPENGFEIILERKGEFPMPAEIIITYADGSSDLVYIPTNETLADKIFEVSVTKLAPWYWVAKEYSFKWSKNTLKIISIEIDFKHETADVERSNNKWSVED